MWAVAILTIGDREEAADALQEALISAFRNAAGYRGEAAVTTWLPFLTTRRTLLTAGLPSAAPP